MITAEKFVTVWQQSSSTKEVAQKLGLKADDKISQRAGNLRKLGVPLKKFPTGKGRRLDISALTELAKSLEKPAAEVNGAQ